MSSILGLAACTGDKTAAISGPLAPLALGAFHPVALVDGCGGGGRFSTCNREHVTEVQRFESSDPTVVAVVDRATGQPASSWQSPLALVGLKVGVATVTAQGIFDDGTTREASQEIEVRAIGGVDPEPICGDRTAGAFFIPCGSSLRVHAIATDGKDTLAGAVASLLMSPGATCSTSETEYGATCVFRPATCPAATTVTTPVSPSFAVSLSTYGAAEVTRIRAEPTNSGVQFVFGPSDMALDIAMFVGEVEACTPLLVSVRTETPEICTGKAGAVAWTESQPGRLYYRVLKEGICRLTVGADPGALTTPVAVPVYFPRGDANDFEKLADSPCTVEKQVVCESYRTGSLVCSGGRWRVQTSCQAGQLCDYVPAGSPGCPGARDCADCRGL